MSKKLYIGQGGASVPSPNHIYIISQAIQRVYTGNNLIWRNIDPPTITAFSVSPNNIDLDTMSSGTVTFTFTVQGTPGQISYAQIVRLPGGGNIGATFVGASGAIINGNLPNILQPTQTTTYRLFARNTGGNTTRDTTVTVTQNPVIRNFRQTGFRQGIPGISADTYNFGATIVGYPRPSVSYRFSTGEHGTLTSSHFTSSGTNTWTLAFTHIFNNANARSVVLTATNSSGTVTETISNINN